MFLVKCPKCKHDMRYMPAGELKKKRCVYCGYSFTISLSSGESRVVKRV